jgi:acyl-CoA synthetase (AMP-forming)/AMP-acid ligase II/acyl carrier protein
MCQLNGTPTEVHALQDFPDNLFDLARWRARNQPDSTGYTFLVDGETEQQKLTYRQLDVQARAIAARIQAQCRPGEHVLLLYGPGLPYVTALFACQYAGVIPVPAYPPDVLRAGRTLGRLQAIVADCGATLALGTDDSLGWFGPVLADQVGLRLALSTDGWQDWLSLPWTAPQHHADDVALLQYTSGSTSSPRGVMVTHRNLWLQFESMRVADNEKSAGVSWLPLYHDLGLIGGVFVPIYYGRPVTLMSPLSFVQRPLRWLLAISRYRAPITGAPNFAFDLCVSKFSPAEAEAEGLDLSCLQIILTGAEPVRADTLDRFSETFAPYGFSPEVWRPCYGLAEATLGVTGVTHGSQVTHVDFSLRQLELNRAMPVTRSDEPARRLVGCGDAIPAAEVLIVDPSRRVALPDGEVGELWVRGPNVARGYWNRPEENEAIFRARLADTGAGPFLRTGDLAFRYQGQFYLTGRLKELMIFWGRNVYPLDVEMTVWSCHPNLKENGCAAFAIEVDGQEQLAVVQEVARPAKVDLEEVARSIRAAIQEEYHVPLHALAFIKVGSLPKTSSGKIQRSLARERFLADDFEVLRQWRFPVFGNGAEVRQAASERVFSREEIQSWLVERIAQHCKVPAGEINPDAPLSSYVMDSVSAVMIAMELQDWLGRSLSPVLLYDSPSLSVLTERLADDSPPAPVAAAAPLPVSVEDLTQSELDEALARLLGGPTE